RLPSIPPASPSRSPADRMVVAARRPAAVSGSSPARGPRAVPAEQPQDGLMTAPSEDRQAAIRQALQPLGRARRPVAEATRQEHINLVQSIQQPADVALHVEPKDDNHWRVTVCTADSLGALSVLAGLFTA